jgi:hypothetical protein
MAHRRGARVGRGDHGLRAVGGARLGALLLLAIAGGADIVAAILRSTIIQHEVPDAVRGRVWGVNFLVLNGGPRLGDMTAGITASGWGATASVVVGGLAAFLGVGAYALAAPELRRYTASGGLASTDDARLDEV